MKVPMRLSASTVRNKPVRAARPSLEGLEDRLLMYAVTGGKFPNGSRITYSFVPDGTSLGGPVSNLFAKMDARFSRAAWQSAFANAAATWAYSANLNLVQVSDSGAPLGSSGNQQGDPNFGDIRISGYTQGNGTLAWAFSPPPSNGGTLAGDILFNTNQLWQLNQDFDLQTVAIHEFGHALGLDHSSFQTADLYGTYQNIRQTLTTDDVNGIQSIWGPRAADWTTGSGGNATLSTAYDTSPNYNNDMKQVILWDLNITSSSDVHWYKIVTPGNASNVLTATMQSSGLSMLSPKVQIYTASGSGLVQATSPNSYGTTVTASISNATPNTTYYVRTAAANGGPSGAGAYALVVNMGNNSPYTLSPPNTAVSSQASQGGGSMSQLAGTAASIKHLISATTEIETEEHVRQIGELTGYGDALKASRKARANTVRQQVGFRHPRGVAREFAMKGKNVARRFLVAARD